MLIIALAWRLIHKMVWSRSSSQHRRYRYILPQAVKFPLFGEVLSLSLTLTHTHMLSLGCMAQELACTDPIIFNVYFCMAEKYEREAKKYWDNFYKRHQDRVRFSPILAIITITIKRNCFLLFCYHLHESNRLLPILLVYNRHLL